MNAIKQQEKNHNDHNLVLIFYNVTWRGKLIDIRVYLN